MLLTRLIKHLNPYQVFKWVQTALSQALVIPFEPPSDTDLLSYKGNSFYTTLEYFIKELFQTLL